MVGFVSPLEDDLRCVPVDDPGANEFIRVLVEFTTDWDLGLFTIDVKFLLPFVPRGIGPFVFGMFVIIGKDPVLSR